MGAVIFNPSFPYRLSHMLLASLLTSALVIAGGSAWCLSKDIYRGAGLAGLRASVTVLAIAAPLQIFAGDLHGLNVREHQPAKVAAMEGLWETTKGAPLVLFAWPDEVGEKNHYAFEIPKLASLILTHDLNGEVQGLGDFAPEDRPPVIPVFYSFRIMVGLGMWFLLLGIWAVIRWIPQKMEHSPWLLRAFMLSTPLGFVATIAGWIVAETGRQPWVVNGLLRTADSVSDISAEMVMASLTLFVIVYSVLFISYLYFLTALVKKGPGLPDNHPKAMRGARVGEVVGEARADLHKSMWETH